MSNTRFVWDVTGIFGGGTGGASSPGMGPKLYRVRNYFSSKYGSAGASPSEEGKS